MLLGYPPAFAVSREWPATLASLNSKADWLRGDRGRPVRSRCSCLSSGRATISSRCLGPSAVASHHCPSHPDIMMSLRARLLLLCRPTNHARRHKYIRHNYIHHNYMRRPSKCAWHCSFFLLHVSARTSGLAATGVELAQSPGVGAGQVCRGTLEHVDR